MSEQTIPTNQGDLTPGQLFNSLYYSSYAANRARGMTPEQYERFFPTQDVKGFEARYQRELQHNAGARIADDQFCSGCGKRGVVGLCGTCQ